MEKVLRFKLIIDSSEARRDLSSFARDLGGVERANQKAARVGQNAWAAYGASIGAASKQLRSMGDIAQRLGRSMTIGLSLPLIGIGVSAVRMAARFEKEMVKVNTLVGVNMDTVQKWRQSMLDLSKEVGRGPGELAKALFVVTSAGIRTAEALDIVKYSAQAAAIGLGETKTIARTVTAAMQAFGSANLSAKEATEVLVKTVREGNLEATELAGALGRVIPVAANLGLEFSDVGAFIATFTRVGVDSYEATTALRALLTNLTKGGKQAKEAFQSVGLELGDLRARLASGEGLAPVLVDIADHFDKAGNAGKEAFAKAIPNVRGFTGMVATARSQMAAYLEISKTMKMATDELGEGFATTTKTMAFTWDQFVADWERAWIKIGDVIGPFLVEDVLPMVEGILDAVARIAEAFQKLPEPVQKAITTFFAFMVLIGPLTKLVGFLFTAFGQLGTIIGSVAAWIGAQGGLAAASGMLMGKFIALAAAINPVIAIVGGLSIVLIAYADDVADAIVATGEWLGWLESAKTSMAGFGSSAGAVEAKITSLAQEFGVSVDYLKLMAKHAGGDKESAGAQFSALAGKLADVGEEFALLRKGIAAGVLTQQEYHAIMLAVVKGEADLETIVKGVTDAIAAKNKIVDEGAQELDWYAQALEDLNEEYEKMSKESNLLVDSIAKLTALGASEAEIAEMLGSRITKNVELLEKQNKEVPKAIHNMDLWIKADERATDAKEELVKTTQEWMEKVEEVTERPKKLIEEWTKWLTTGATINTAFREMGLTTTELEKVIDEYGDSIEPARLKTLEMMLALSQVRDAEDDWNRVLRETREKMNEKAQQVDKLVRLYGEYREKGTDVVDINRALGSEIESVVEEYMALNQVIPERLKLAYQETQAVKEQIRINKQFIDAQKEVSKRVNDLINTIPLLHTKINAWARAGANNNLIVAEMGEELIEAGEYARKFGIELDEPTKKLIRMAEQAKRHEEVTKAWEDTWNNAMGNVVSTFGDSVAKMIFDGEAFSFDLKTIFKDLGKAIVKIMVTGMFSPLLQKFSEWGRDLGDSLFSWMPGGKNKGKWELGGQGSGSGIGDIASGILDNVPGMPSGIGGIVGGITGMFGGGKGGGQAVPVFVVNWPKGGVGGFNVGTAVNIGKGIVNAFKGSSGVVANAIAGAGQLPFTGPAAIGMNPALLAGGTSNFMLGTGFEALPMPGAVDTGGLLTGGKIGITEPWQTAAADHAKAGSLRGPGFGGRALGALSGLGLGFGVGASIGGVKGGVIGGAGGALMGALFPALMSNPWTAVAAMAVQGITMAIKKWWPKSNYSKVANEVGRDFGIEVGKKTVEEFAKGIGLGKDQLKHIRKDVSSSPKFFKEVLLPQAMNAGEGAVQALIEAFSRVQVSEAVGKDFERRDPFNGSTPFQKLSSGDYVFDFSDQVLEAIETGNFKAFNEMFAAVFGTEGLKKVFPDWEKLLVKTEKEAKESAENVGKAFEGLKEKAAAANEAIGDYEGDIVSKLAMETIGKSISQIGDWETAIAAGGTQAEEAMEKLLGLQKGLQGLADKMGDDMPEALAAFLEALNATVDKLQNPAGDDLDMGGSGGPGKPPSGPMMDDILAKAGATTEVGSPEYWRRVYDLINSDRNWTSKQFGDSGSYMGLPGMEGGADLSKWSAMSKIAMEQWRKAMGAGTAPIPDNWPQLAKGGYITSAGMAYLHSDELVIPRQDIKNFREQLLTPRANLSGRNREWSDRGDVRVEGVEVNTSVTIESRGGGTSDTMDFRDRVIPEISRAVENNIRGIAEEIARQVEKRRRAIVNNKS